MEIVMIQTQQGSRDGVNVETFAAGLTYKFDGPAEEALARTFLALGWARDTLADHPFFQDLPEPLEAIRDLIIGPPVTLIAAIATIDDLQVLGYIAHEDPRDEVAFAAFRRGRALIGPLTRREEFREAEGTEPVTPPRPAETPSGPGHSETKVDQPDEQKRQDVQEGTPADQNGAQDHGAPPAGQDGDQGGTGEPPAGESNPGQQEGASAAQQTQGAPTEGTEPVTPPAPKAAAKKAGTPRTEG